jgi:hypothetical protein
MGWGGWLLIERSRDGARPTEVGYNFPPNVAYVKAVFKDVPPRTGNLR